ncbi:DMT family transporter [Roseateles sp. DAIF2]|uniref:DMT family transporter n=1 Tax=Roseateles sp. DAIF2 TaxID=2714952 RepID=UPI0018A32E9A|nr:DMT family transporter [Roseateles sp. DAIF2]QPF74366.1 DMT family transporter [Roseateles sp. DAIF2]
MTHRRAVLLMLVVTLLWSMAGVVSRHLEAARSFEVTFWRSAFNALALLAALAWMRGPAALWGQLRQAPRAVWVSGLCWATMFTAFMLALTLTSVANVLVTMALGPLLTALFARLFLQHRLPARTWAAIGLASAGIAWMFGHEMQGGTGAWAGMGIAFAVPLAAASNWTLLQHSHRVGGQGGGGGDMLVAVLLGALISAALTLPLAWPLQAGAHDLTLLAGLGLFQLALPCLLVVRLTRVLAAPEIALLGLLEVLFGVLWTWLGAGEAPSSATLAGGAMVLAALVGNELLGLRAPEKKQRQV